MRDYSFELPQQTLEADSSIGGKVRVGAVEHDLSTGWEQPAEVFTYPGGYAHHRDSVGPDGTPRPDDMPHVHVENKARAKLQAQRHACAAPRRARHGQCRPSDARTALPPRPASHRRGRVRRLPAGDAGAAAELPQRFAAGPRAVGRLRLPAARSPLPPAHASPAAPNPWRADRDGGRHRRRRRDHRRLRPREGAVPLGPPRQARRAELVLGASRPGASRRRLRHRAHPPRRSGSAGGVRGGRPGPAVRGGRSV